MTSASEGKLQLQRFSIQTVHRSELTDAPYNPRTIDDYARKKLRDQLKKRGLVMPLVWNKRTGHIVSGHQRISLLDELNGSPDYRMDVAVIDVPLKDEKVLNLFINNASAMGSWDATRFSELFHSEEDPVSFTKDAGFDRIDLEQILPLDDLKSAFNPSPAAQALAEDVADFADEAASIREEDREAQKTQDAIAARAKEKERAAEDRDFDYYIAVVFESQKALMSFLNEHGLDPSQRYVAADQFVAAVKGEK